MGNSLAPSRETEIEISLAIASQEQLVVHPVTRTICQVCNTSFTKITRGGRRSKRNSMHSEIDFGSIHNFYNEFYSRLERTDTSHLNFKSILHPTTTTKSQADVRGAILLRIIRFVLNVQSESNEVNGND